jgi:MYXO-CTERM domain-containing protein
LLAALALGVPSSVMAAVYSCNEAGLNAGLAAGGLVQFSCTGASTIPITSGKTVSVSGTIIDGQNLVTFQGSAGFTLFAVASGVSATFRNLTITGASVTALGAVMSCGPGTTCVLDTVALNADDASSGGALLYAASGSISVSNSTISGGNGNVLMGDTATLSMTSSTVSAVLRGVVARNGTTATVQHSTLVSLNTGVQAVGATDSISLGHVLFANNAADVSGATVTSTGFNLIEDGLAGAQPTDIVGAPARVLALASNGGPTQTVGLQGCSPAINTGSTTATQSFDQRGSGFPRVLQGRQDIGAFESNLTAVPCITTQPVGQTVFATQTLTLSVAAITGQGTLSYQWRQGGTAISGATSATYTKAAALADAGSYDVVVTNSAGSVTSNAVTVTVNGPPSITTQPVGQTVFAGQTLTVSVAASGASLTYRWRRNGVVIAGATSATYTKTAVLTDAGSYDVIVTNPAGSVTSNAVTVTVNGPPSITTQPVGQAVFANQALALSVTASGASLSYQWRLNGTAIAGATSATYAKTAAPADAGSYDVVISNPAGSVTSNAVTVTVDGPPAVTVDPVAVTLFAGQPLALSVEATGNALSYQWRRDGVALAQATGAAFALPAVTLQDAGAYDCVVTNPAGSVTSAAAAVTVNGPPVVTTQPASVDVGVGDAFNLAVVATGEALTYQWRKDDVDLAGATSASYGVATAVETDSGDYTVVVTNPAGSVTSDKATVHVQPVKGEPSGCGCTSETGGLLPVLALAALALRRRRA